MTVDPNFLTENAPAEQEPFIHRWCRCGHRVVTHFDIPELVSTEGLIVFEDVQCHGIGRKGRECKCEDFRPKKRKNRIKFFFTGRG